MLTIYIYILAEPIFEIPETFLVTKNITKNVYRL